MKYRALDMFCGAGGAAMGLHRAGFDVTGIDIKPQPRYPFRFIQADALKPPVRLEDFDLIWASPPCQGYSLCRNLPWLQGKTWPMLIPAVRELISGRHYVIENVRHAPLSGFELRGGHFGIPMQRRRKFETSFLVLVPSHPDPEPVGLAGWRFARRLDMQRDIMRGLMPWASRTEASQAIPPAYAEHIGQYAMMALEAKG